MSIHAFIVDPKICLNFIFTLILSPILSLLFKSQLHLMFWLTHHLIIGFYYFVYYYYYYFIFSFFSLSSLFLHSPTTPLIPPFLRTPLPYPFFPTFSHFFSSPPNFYTWLETIHFFPSLFFFIFFLLRHLHSTTTSNTHQPIPLFFPHFLHLYFIFFLHTCHTPPSFPSIFFFFIFFIFFISQKPINPSPLPTGPPTSCCRQATASQWPLSLFCHSLILSLSHLTHFPVLFFIFLSSSLLPIFFSPIYLWSPKNV